MSSIQVDCQQNSSSSETFFSDNSLSFDGFGDGNADFAFNDSPLGMIVPATPSLSISQGLLYPSLPFMEGGTNLSPYPSLQLDSFLHNEDSNPSLSESALCPTDGSQSNEMTVDFCNGPLPQGSIRNLEVSLSSSEEIITGIDPSLPLLSLPSFSPFDPPYVPDSGDSQSDYLAFTESDSHSENHPIQHQKSKQSRKQKKWSCSECCYLNNLSMPTKPIRIRNKTMCELWVPITFYPSQNTKR